jgi:hypothetical protein
MDNRAGFAPLTSLVQEEQPARDTLHRIMMIRPTPPNGEKRPAIALGYDGREAADARVPDARHLLSSTASRSPQRTARGDLR